MAASAGAESSVRLLSVPVQQLVPRPSGQPRLVRSGVQVVTLDGSEVWRQRHYRVLLGDVPGSFLLTTEDNGISLKEHWRIVDVDDDLAWAALHYAGAAPAVGQSYAGSLLVSRDGRVPVEAPRARLRAAFERAGVAAFELYAIGQDEATNECCGGKCGPPPLTDFSTLKRYSSTVLASRSG
mmetsp:Transcript_51956/g.168849  ORF Transcript_51956/g.168849 Transcript_51956/m.168849 type:complete len:182 (-) Transcript_51956:411-956(-)